MDGRTLACGAVAAVENVRHAAALARRGGAELAVVFVRPRLPASWGLVPAGGAFLLQWWEDLELAVLLDTTRALDPFGVRWRFHTGSGDPASCLLRVADAVDAGLLVVGAARGGALRALLHPPVARRLTRRGRRPVLVVP
jgi:nucleotide-binding universal stress UspA family protein